MGKKKRRKSRKEFQEGDEESGSESDSSSMSEKSKQEVLPVAAAKKTALPGAILKARRQPPWYFVRILEEERPDLLGPNGKLNLEIAISNKCLCMAGCSIDRFVADGMLRRDDHTSKYSGFRKLCPNVYIAS